MSDSAVLRTVERRVRSLAVARLETLRTAYAARVGSVIGASGALSGTELLSRRDLHTALVSAVAVAQAGTVAAVRVGYRASGNLARVGVVAELARLGFTAAESEEGDSAYLAVLVAGVTAAFVAVTQDLQDGVRGAFDGVSGLAASVAAARVLTTAEAVDRAVRRLSVRVITATTVAVHRGYTDTQQELYAAYGAQHPQLRLLKRWQVQSADPCGFCALLDGQVVDVDAEFDRTLAPPGTPALPVFHNLLGPPRHPNCRCRLVYEASGASAAVQAQVAAAPPVAVVRLSATAVRRMPTTQFAAISAFFAAAGRRIKTLLRQVRAGG